jgi:hypothetical protein
MGPRRAACEPAPHTSAAVTGKRTRAFPACRWAELTRETVGVEYTPGDMTTVKGMYSKIDAMRGESRGQRACALETGPQ